jgi:hypothetical protein
VQKKKKLFVDYDRMQSGRWLQNLEKPALSIIKVHSYKAGFSETLFAI